MAWATAVPVVAFGLICQAGNASGGPGQANLETGQANLETGQANLENSIGSLAG